ncbi:MAG TPA: hypothetical protein VLB09_07750, partial [Nitrospiria bacterium]|nr:hypothetical protein [Nitrospiria bacterium]
NRDRGLKITSFPFPVNGVPSPLEWSRSWLQQMKPPGARFQGVPFMKKSKNHACFYGNWRV